MTFGCKDADLPKTAFDREATKLIEIGPLGSTVAAAARETVSMSYAKEPRGSCQQTAPAADSPPPMSGLYGRYKAQ